MSRYFVLPEEGIGPGGDIVFRQSKTQGFIYSVYVGDKRLGQVFNMGRAWSGLSFAKESEFFKVRLLEGFATRMDAATFVIKHHGYWMADERDRGLT